MLYRIEKYLKRINDSLLLVIILAGYFLLFVGAYYSHPNAEDFSLTGATLKEGVIMSTLILLTSDDGRYFTNVLHGLNPLAWGLLEYHKYIAIFSVLFFVAAFCFFISAIFKPSQWHNNLLSSGLILLVCLALSSSLVHELYWMVSSFAYFYSWIFWFLWVGCFLRYRANEKPRLGYYFFSNLLLFLAVGLNEMFLVLNVISVGYLVYIDIQKNKVGVTLHLPIIITLVSSVLLFISSPGTTERWLHHIPPAEENIGYWVVVQNSITHFVGEFFRVLTKSGIVIAAAFLISGRFLNLKTNSFIPLNQRHTIRLFALCIIVLYLMTWGFYLPMGQTEPHFPQRIYTSIGTGIIICLILFVPFFLQKPFSNSNSKIHFIAILTIGVGLFGSKTNLRLIIDEYSAGLLQLYDREMNQRYIVIEQSKKYDGFRQVAVIDTLTAKPQSIHYGPDIEPNRTPAYWNRAYEAFFGINEVRLKNDTVFK